MRAGILLTNDGGYHAAARWGVGVGVGVEMESCG